MTRYEDKFYEYGMEPENPGLAGRGIRAVEREIQGTKWGLNFRLLFGENPESFWVIQKVIGNSGLLRKRKNRKKAVAEIQADGGSAGGIKPPGPA